MKKLRKQSKKMTIEKLAQMTANEFFDVNSSLQELKDGQKQILGLLLEQPSKKSFDDLKDRVSSIDARLTRVEERN